MNTNVPKLAKRCYREIKNSKNEKMLGCAYRYYRLFYAHCVRIKTNRELLNYIDKTIIALYKKRKKQLTIV